MRITKVAEGPAGFKPVTVLVTLENEEEMRLFVGFAFLDAIHDNRDDTESDKLADLAKEYNSVEAIHALDLAIKTDSAMEYRPDERPL